MASDDIDYDPRFDPVFQRGHEDDLPRRVVPAPVAEPVPVSVVGNPASLRGNPWVVVLWVLALGLSAAGLWATWYAQDLYASPTIGNVESYYVMPAVLSAIAPWLLGVGLLALVAVVFLHAVRWRQP